MTPFPIGLRGPPRAPSSAEPRRRRKAPLLAKHCGLGSSRAPPPDAPAASARLPRPGLWDSISRQASGRVPPPPGLFYSLLVLLLVLLLPSLPRRALLPPPPRESGLWAAPLAGRQEQRRPPRPSSSFLSLSRSSSALILSKMAAWGRRRAGAPVSGGSASGGGAGGAPRERISLSATDCYIVHEIYNGENAQDQFEYELEQALEAQYKYIVIEPTRIGDETARWITVGNCLHKTAVLAGTACLFSPLALPLDYSHYISLPAGVLSIACGTLYGISWQFDPCCKYQVEYNAYKLSRLPLHTLTSSTPVVLVRKDDLHRKRLHNTIALAALVYCVKKIYELYAV